MSNAPGTCTTRMSSSRAPWRQRASTAPACSRSVIRLLNCETTRPKRLPLASILPRITRTMFSLTLQQRLQIGEQMAEFFLFDPQVLNVALMRRHLDRPSLHDFNPVALQAGDLVGVIRQQAYLGDTQVAQDLGADAVVTQVLFKAQVQIGFHGVEPLVLQRVRA